MSFVCGACLRVFIWHGERSETRGRVLDTKQNEAAASFAGLCQQITQSVLRIVCTSVYNVYVSADYTRLLLATNASPAAHIVRLTLNASNFVPLAVSQTVIHTQFARAPALLYAVVADALQFPKSINSEAESRCSFISTYLSHTMNRRSHTACLAVGEQNKNITSAS